MTGNLWDTLEIFSYLKVRCEIPKTELMLIHFKDSNMTSYMSHIPVISMSCRGQEMGFVIKDEKASKGGTRKWHVLSPHYLPDHVGVTFMHTIPLNLPATLWARHCLYLLDEDTEGQRGEVTCSSLYSETLDSWFTLLESTWIRRPHGSPLLRSEWGCRKGRKIRWWGRSEVNS